MGKNQSINGPDNARQRRCAPNLSSAATQLQTVRDLVRIAVSAFESAGLSYGHGSENAYDEAVALVFWGLYLPPDTPDAMLSASLTPVEIAAVLALITDRVQSREPAAYLTGEAWFRGLRFKCDARALVPRSLLVEAMQEALPSWLNSMAASLDQQPGWPAAILDLCTGGGSIAIHAAHMFQQASITAIDIDEPALSLCEENIALHGLNDQVTTLRSNVLDQCDDATKFDLILSNPPYVPTQSMQALPAEFRAEPSLALSGGDDGMDIIRRILLASSQHLTDNGLLILELGHEIDAFVRAFPDLPFATLATHAGDEMIIILTSADLEQKNLASTT